MEEWETAHLMKMQWVEKAEQELKVTQAEAAEQDDVVEVTDLVAEGWEETILMANMISQLHQTQAQAVEDLIQILLQELAAQEYA